MSDRAKNNHETTNLVDGQYAEFFLTLGLPALVGVFSPRLAALARRTWRVDVGP